MTTSKTKEILESVLEVVDNKKEFLGKLILQLKEKNASSELIKEVENYNDN